MAELNPVTAHLTPALRLRWLDSGRAGLAAMVRAIGAARESVKLQTYIFRDDDAGRRLREALVAASARGVRVRVLIDALGSFALPADFFTELEARGGECRRFNPLHPRRFLYRNHRKSLVCDRETAIIGGFNIAEEYDGDGVETGWRDFGLKLGGPLAAAVARSFDRLYVLSDFLPRHFARLRRARDSGLIDAPPGQVIFSGPGLGPNPLKRALLRDLGKAGRVRIITPYFLPTWGLRRRLMKIARHGGQVELLLPGTSDVPLARHAGRALYGRLIRAGVQIFEYQPKILHSKLVIADDAVYAGSANFNTRSLHIDFELMVRIDDAAVREHAGALFSAHLAHSCPIEPAEWMRRRGLWERIRQRIAYFVVARLDPLVAGWLWRKRG